MISYTIRVWKAKRWSSYIVLLFFFFFVLKNKLFDPKNVSNTLWKRLKKQISFRLDCNKDYTEDNTLLGENVFIGCSTPIKNCLQICLFFLTSFKYNLSVSGDYKYSRDVFCFVAVFCGYFVECFCDSTFIWIFFSQKTFQISLST